MNKKGIQAWRNGFKNLICQCKELVLELLYPSTCILCGRVSKQGICEECRKQYPIIREPLCMCCGKPIYDEEKECCEDCSKHGKSFDQGRSLWVHAGKVKSSIYKFKYSNRRVYAETYGQLLVKKYDDRIRLWNPQVIIPVPLHPHRKRQRGFNQAEVLARVIAREISLDIPVRTNLVARKKETFKQKQLNEVQRFKNMRNAFQINSNNCIPEVVMLVDDIYTTGATVNEISRVLKEHGVKKVYFLTISIGQGF